MIISDDAKFIFIHIPKCAGTSVRECIKGYDDSKGKFSITDGFIEDVGRVDMAHLPIFILKKYFVSEYEKLLSYQTFAILRDPYKRFYSSTYQRINMYSDISVKNISNKEMISEVDQVINFLEKTENVLLPHDYIHFQKQSDYVFDGNDKVVKNLYMAGEVDKLLYDLNKQVGGTLSISELQEHKNKAVLYRNPVVGGFMDAIMPIYAAMLKPLVPVGLENMLKGALYKDGGSAFDDIFLSDYVKDFVESYYSRDINLIQKRKIFHD